MDPICDKNSLPPIPTPHDGISHDGISHDGISHDGISHDGISHDGISQLGKAIKEIFEFVIVFEHSARNKKVATGICIPEIGGRGAPRFRPSVERGLFLQIRNYTITLITPFGEWTLWQKKQTDQGSFYAFANYIVRRLRAQFAGILSYEEEPGQQKVYYVVASVDKFFVKFQEPYMNTALVPVSLEEVKKKEKSSKYLIFCSHRAEGAIYKIGQGESSPIESLKNAAKDPLIAKRMWEMLQKEHAKKEQDKIGIPKQGPFSSSECASIPELVSWAGDCIERLVESDLILEGKHLFTALSLAKKEIQFLIKLNRVVKKNLGKSNWDAILKHDAAYRQIRLVANPGNRKPEFTWAKIFHISLAELFDGWEFAGRDVHNHNYTIVKKEAVSKVECDLFIYTIAVMNIDLCVFYDIQNRSDDPIAFTISIKSPKLYWDIIQKGLDLVVITKERPRLAPISE